MTVLNDHVYKRSESTSNIKQREKWASIQL